MNFNSFQREAMSFRKETADDTYALYNLAAEVGELMSIYAKGRRDGFQPDAKVQIKKELGDILWQVAAVAADEGYSLDDVATANIEKLTSRKQRGTLDGSGDNR